MDNLWFFSETEQIFVAPDAVIIVDENGLPKSTATQFEVRAGTSEEFGDFCNHANQVILVSSAAEFKPDYVAAITTNIPRLALIKFGTPISAREQLDKLELDAYILSPFQEESVKHALGKFAEEKKTLLALQ